MPTAGQIANVTFGRDRPLSAVTPILIHERRIAASFTYLSCETNLSATGKNGTGNETSEGAGRWKRCRNVFCATKSKKLETSLFLRLFSVLLLRTFNTNYYLSLFVCFLILKNVFRRTYRSQWVTFEKRFKRFFLQITRILTLSELPPTWNVLSCMRPVSPGGA